MDEDVKTIQDYFTADVNDRIRDISEQEMLKKLRNLEQSDYWIAILKYNQIRISISQSALFTGDPIKDPAGMTRQQGLMLGLSDLQNAVITLTQEKEAERTEVE